MKTLPKKLFVCIREAGTDGEYLFATTSVDDFDDGEIFGRYDQTSLERIEITTTTRLIVQRPRKKRVEVKK